MYQISEFSKLTFISVRMLRYYDKNDVFKPIYVDTSNGYRYYSASQIPTLNRIKTLRDFGFTVQEIKYCLSLNEQEFLSVIKEKEASLTTELIEKETILKRIQRFNSTSELTSHFEIDVALKSIPSLSVLSLRKIIPTYFHESELWLELTALIKEKKIVIPFEYLSFAIFYDNDYRDIDVDVEIAVTIPVTIPVEFPFSSYELAGYPLAASIMVIGSYQNIDPTYQEFAKWLENHSEYKMIGNTRQIAHKGPWSTENENEYITELLIPIEKRK